MTLPGNLDQYGEDSVREALACFESIGTLEFAGRDAEIAEELLRCALVRATVQSRFITTDGEVRLKLQSQGHSVAGAWMKRVLDQSAASAPQTQNRPRGFGNPGPGGTGSGNSGSGGSGLGGSGSGTTGYGSSGMGAAGSRRAG